MAAFDRNSFTDYQLEDEGKTLVIKKPSDIWKVPVKVYAFADKVVANGKVIKNRQESLP